MNSNYLNGVYQKLKEKIGKKLQLVCRQLKRKKNLNGKQKNIKNSKSTCNRFPACALFHRLPRSRSTSIPKDKYKTIIRIIKYLPLIMAIGACIVTFINPFSKGLIIFSILFYPSIVFIITFLLLSRLLNFCFAHRSPLYYLFTIRLLDVLFLYRMITPTIMTSLGVIFSLTFLLTLIVSHVWTKQS